MEEIQTSNYRMWSPSLSFNAALFSSIGQMEISPDTYISNISAYYDSIYQNGFPSFTEFRKTSARMNDENQQYMMDIVTATGKYIGWFGFIRVNRLIPVREASLCMHLLADYVRSNLLELLAPLADIARQARFRVQQWNVSIPDNPSGGLLRLELERSGFVQVGPSEYCQDVDRFTNTKVGASDVRRHPQGDLGLKDKDAPLDQVCSECGQTFFLKTGEKIFFELKELQYPRRCAACRYARRISLATAATSGGGNELSHVGTFGEDSLETAQSPMVAAVNSAQPMIAPSHVLHASSQSPVIPEVAARSDTESPAQKYCPFWIHGTCRYGSGCRNLHGTQVTLPLLASSRDTLLQERASLQVAPPYTSAPDSQNFDPTQQDDYQYQLKLQQQSQQQQQQLLMMTETQYYAMLLLDMLNSANTAWLLMLRFAEEEPPSERGDERADDSAQQLCEGVALLELTNNAPVSTSSAQPDQHNGSVAANNLDTRDSRTDEALAGTLRPSQEIPWHYFSISTAHAVQNARSVQPIPTLYSLRSLPGLQRARIDRSILDLNLGVVQNFASQKQAERMQAQQQAEAQRAAYEFFMHQQQQMAHEQQTKHMQQLFEQQQMMAQQQQMQQQHMPDQQQRHMVSPYPPGPMPYAPLSAYAHPAPTQGQPSHRYPVHVPPHSGDRSIPPQYRGSDRQLPDPTLMLSTPTTAFSPVQPQPVSSGPETQVRQPLRGRLSQDARDPSRRRQRPTMQSQQLQHAVTQGVEQPLPDTVTAHGPEEVVPSVPVDVPSPLPNSPATLTDFLSQESSVAPRPSANPSAAVIDETHAAASSTVSSAAAAPIATPAVSATGGGGSARRSRREYKGIATTIAAAAAAALSVSEVDSPATAGSEPGRARGGKHRGGSRREKRH